MIKTDLAEKTQVSKQQLSQWLRRCKQDEPVSPDDDRYVSLQDLRGDDHMVPILDCIELTGPSSCQLFSGYKGTGKSTELLRLKQMAEEQGYQVLMSNAQEYHDLFHPLAIEELLVILAGAFGEATATVVGKDVIKEGYWGRFLDFLSRDVEIDALKIPGTDLKVAIAHGKPFWAEIRKRLSQTLGKLRDHCHAFIVECLAHLRRHAPDAEGVVFIFDSLERLMGPEDRFRETMDSVVRVFSQYAEFLHLPDCHVVYTVPPYVQMLASELDGRYDRQLHILPAVKVLEPGPDIVPHKPGTRQMMRIVDRRVPIKQLFGDRSDLAETLCVQSGGHLRTLLLFLRELLVRARRSGLPADEHDLKAVLQTFGESVEQAVRVEGAHLLFQVLKTGRIDHVKDEDLALLARYMDTQVVLCYRNGGGWYEVHPLVRDHVERLAKQDTRGDPRP